MVRLSILVTLLAAAPTLANECTQVPADATLPAIEGAAADSGDLDYLDRKCDRFVVDVTEPPADGLVLHLGAVAPKGGNPGSCASALVQRTVWGESDSWELIADDIVAATWSKTLETCVSSSDVTVKKAKTAYKRVRVTYSGEYIHGAPWSAGVHVVTPRR